MKQVVPSAVVFLVILIGSALAAGMLAGLPKDIAEYAKWTKVAQNLDTGGPHSGKNKIVFANAVAAKAWKARGALPDGSVIVKTAGDVNKPDFVAVMTKTMKGWRYEEYMPKSGKYSVAMSGAVCQGCHEQVKAKDYAFTRP